jgi:hypothetical protein
LYNYFQGAWRKIPAAAKKGNFELADITGADKIGLAFRPLPALFYPVIALVYHPYTAVVTQTVFGGHLLQKVTGMQSLQKGSVLFLKKLTQIGKL